jgi:hypothetical protein
MEEDDIPASLLARHLELAQINAAIKAYHAGEPFTARRPTCGGVTKVPEAGALWVTCGTGCTKYREHYKR